MSNQTLKTGQTYTAENGLPFLILKYDPKDKLYLGVAYLKTFPVHIGDVEELRYWFKPDGCCVSEPKKGSTRADFDLRIPTKERKDILREIKVEITIIDRFPESWDLDYIKEYMTDCLELDDPEDCIKKLDVQRLSLNQDQE